MKSKFAKIVHEAQAELLEQQGAPQVNPEEVEGMIRWAAQGDPNTFKQFDGQQGEQYVGAMVNAYRTSQQQNPAAQQQNPATQTDPAAQQQQQADPNTQPATSAPTTANAPTTI